MAFVPISDDTTTITIVVNPLEGRCTIDRASIVYPASMNPGQTATFGASYSNTGTGPDRFRLLFTLTDPSTGDVLASSEKISPSGVAVGSGQTMSATLTLPTTYAKSSVYFNIDGGHESGFYV